MDELRAQRAAMLESARAHPCTQERRRPAGLGSTVAKGIKKAARAVGGEQLARKASGCVPCRKRAAKLDAAVPYDAATWKRRARRLLPGSDD